jgi:hypothetical protein
MRKSDYYYSYLFCFKLILPNQKKMKRLSCMALSLLALVIFFSGCEKEEKNTAPVASFTITPDTGIPGTTFTFDASATSDAEDAPAALLVRWDWETDGLFDTDFSTNKVLSRQFTQPGTFLITLEVKDLKGLGHAITKSLTITGKIPEVLTDTISEIEAYSAIGGGEVTNDFGLAVTERGVCWSTSQNPTVSDNYSSNGTGTGKFGSVMTGLTTNTTYYVRAYATNSIGTAYGEQVQFTTLLIWACGHPITITHVAGSVAPVTKTVTYGTVTNIPGAVSKCWITQNLGADHQAVAIDDATEPSAGWYWQFNRMQGYKHDGTTRTPGTAWISIIDEDSDWLAANDPCTIEFGNGWRIPSQSEWVIVNDVGGWNNWNGPWNSALKMHAGGYLVYNDGSLIKRGVGGAFWSNLQGVNTTAWYERYDNSQCGYAGNLKALGNSLRCIRD